MKRDEWVRVKDESELRPGMAVQLRNCASCGNKTTLTLFAPRPGLQGHCEGCKSPSGWESTHDKCGHPLSCFCIAIPEGRLYRLAAWQFDEESDDTTAPAKVLVGMEER